MPQLYVLYEHASGFSIFRTTEFEEVAVFLPQVRESVLNVSKFRSNVFFVAYQPFKGKIDALRNMQNLNAGELDNDLQLFLENNVPRTKKSKQTVVLGVEDPDLAPVISDKLGIKCISSGLVIEIIRGIRFHFYKLIKGFKDEDSGKQSQLALAHHYSRARLQFSATRQDSMIIENTNFVDELEKDIRTLGKRIRGSYAFHFPELFRIIPHDIELYIQCVNIVGDRKNMPDDIEEKLCAVLEKSSVVETILHAAHSSMGSDIFPVDLENIKMLCERAISLIKKRQSSQEYLRSLMNRTAPNISALLGENVGSKLISRAGGLEKLAKLPSSTVQVLGAEKNFFRSLKFKGKKIHFNSLTSKSFMNKAGGKKSRVLSNKCCLAARIDCFSKTKKDFGKQLVQDVINNLKYTKNIKIQDEDGTLQQVMSANFESNSEKTPLNGSIERNIIENSDGRVTDESNFKEQDIINNSHKVDSEEDTYSESYSKTDEAKLKSTPLKRKKVKTEKQPKKINNSTNRKGDEDSVEDNFCISNKSQELTGVACYKNEVAAPLENTAENSQVKGSSKKRKSEALQTVTAIKNQGIDVSEMQIKKNASVKRRSLRAKKK